MENIQGKVQDQMQNMSEEKKEDILANFNQFKSYLSDKVAKGEKLGLGEEQLAKTTEMVAGYLANHEDPKNREEHLLQQLWKNGDKEQQHAMAHMLLNMVRSE